MLKNLLIFLSLVTAFNVFGSHHFTELYETDDGWRVDHFMANPGELQELVESRGFRFQFEALEFAEIVRRNYPTMRNFPFVSREPGVRPLWTVTNEWSLSWEKKYSDWVRREFDKDFFTRTGVSTDCADVAYALRWIFARENGLPAAATLSGSSTLVTQLSAKRAWDRLPGDPIWHKDQRFMAALRWLLSAVYTKTLFVDTYPVGIRQDAIAPGLIYHMGAHVEVFSQVSLVKGEVPFLVSSSTVPQAVRTMSERLFMESANIDASLGGLVQFRWPVRSASAWALVPKNKMEFYSLEQYDENLCADERHFTLCLLKKLGIDFDREEIVRRLISDLEKLVAFRHQVVQDGFKFCRENDCAPGSVGYEDWSTPSRDKRLREGFRSVKKIAQVFGALRTYEDWLRTALIKVPFSMRVKDFEARFLRGFASHDPRSSVEERWAKDDDSIVSSITRTFEEREVLRNKLIADAEFCRQGPRECQRDSKLFDRFSSAEIDHSNRELFGSWMAYAKDHQIGASFPAQTKRFVELWKRSPAPWDSIDERLGNIGPQEGHLLDGQSVTIATPGNVLVDHRRLYDVGDRTYVDLGSIQEIYFDVSVSRFFASDGENYLVLDESLRELAKFPRNNKNSRIDAVHYFGGGKIFVSECLRPTGDPLASCLGRSGQVLDLLSFQRGDVLSFARLLRDEMAPKSLLIAGAVNTSFSLRKTGPEFRILPPLPLSVASAIALGEHRYLVVLSSEQGARPQQLGYYGPEGFGPLDISESIDIQRVNSAYALVTFGRKNFVLNLFEGTRLNEHFELGPKVSEDVRLLTGRRNGNIDFWIVDGAEPFFRIPYSIKFEYPPVVSAGRDWFSLETGNVVSYSGALLTSSESFMTGLCQVTNYSRFCVGVEDKILLQHYMRPRVPGQTYYSYARFGDRTGASLDRLHGYHITRFEADPLLENSLVDTAPPKVETGTAINLGTTHVLWYP